MKMFYTTGEVAQICNVSQQTVIRCFDAGKLRGFRVPGSRFRRIPRENLIQFMKENQIPLDKLDSGKKRVLVVDDDEAITSMFNELLERDGRFEVRTATTGYDAGMITQEFRPDIILLDYMLPDINGNVVCRAIRGNADMNHTRIIIISGVVNRSEIDDLLREGADDFIQKPFDIDQVVRRIATLVGV